MTDLKEKSFEFAADFAKQLINLSTVIVAITVTFSKDLFDKAIDCDKNILLYAWVSYFFCIFFGIWFLGALVGTLADKSKYDSQTIMTNNCRIPAFLQFTSFLCGLFFTIFYAVKSL
ncbi:hypothetical protein GEN90_24865 [Vibrio parahaemolyticus]|nr:hypothetical protein [Vibrio parahaemolyticus]